MLRPLFWVGSSNHQRCQRDLLTPWAAARAGIGVDTTTATQDPNAPIAPVWTPGVSPSAAALGAACACQQVVLRHQRQALQRSRRDRRLSAAFCALFRASRRCRRWRARRGQVSCRRRRATTQTQFARGLTELEAFFAQQQFDDIRLAQGDRVDAAQTTLAMASKSEDYTDARDPSRLALR